VAENFETFASYAFRVSAKNLVGQGPWLETTGTVTIPARPLVAPSPPSEPLDIKPKTMTSIEVKWQPPVDDGGSEIIAYQVAFVRRLPK